MSEYSAGDLIEARKGEGIIRDRLAQAEYGNTLRLNDAQWGLAYFETHGWVVTLIEKAEPQLPQLPKKYGAVVLIETEEGRRHFLAWRAAGEWDLLNPRGESATTNDPYEYAREWSASKISAVTILKEGNS